MMIPKYLQVGASVDVEVCGSWLIADVIERTSNSVAVRVRSTGRTVHVHKSVIRRDLRPRKPAKCWISRVEFLTAVGVVNAQSSTTRTGIRFETKYDGVAERIESMARGISATVLRTRTDDGTIVVTIKGFRQVADARCYITTNGRRRYFDTVEEAQQVASEIFDRTGVAVGIENTDGR